MRTLFLSVAFLACVALVGDGVAQGTKKVEPKCPVSGKAIDKDQSVMHNGGKVYFCCGNCPATFEKDTAKFATKANYQLYVTGQATEKHCPFTGKDLNPETKTDVGGMPVCFCCQNCQGKVTDQPTAKQIDLIFTDKNFKQGFDVKAAK